MAGDATPKRVYDGDVSFIAGMNSLSQGSDLPPSAYAFGWNLTSRSGVLRARPGFNTSYDLPDGSLQGFTVFTPRIGFPQHIAVVDGQVYVSDYPYKTFREVPGATMSPDSEQVFLCQTVRTAQRNPDTSITLVDPQNLLMFQDGINPPAYYDGNTVTAISGNVLNTPQGTCMAWDGFRLWVARGEKLFASDISDPLSFYEQQFNTLGGLNYFILPGNITAMGMTGGTQIPQLLVFTETSCTTFQSNITDRTQWPSIMLFQRLILPGVGCVSQRSLITRSGLLAWYSQDGWTEADSAEMTMESVRTFTQDAEMIRSRSQLSDDLSRITAAAKDNFLLVSVPHESLYNTHTWVNDAAPQSLTQGAVPAAWSSIWTGVRPVQWGTIEADGKKRLFCASADEDGHNRVYEAFQEAGQDNGVDIPWAVELRPYTGQTAEPKNLVWAEIYLLDVLGQFDVAVSWSGQDRGRWKPMLVTNFMAARGNLDATEVYDSDSMLYSLKSQSRQIRTQEVTDLKPDILASCGTESEFNENIDTAFQIRIDCSGHGAIRMVRAALNVVPDLQTRVVPKPETQERYVRFDGAGSRTEDNLDAALPTFTSTKTTEARFGNFVTSATSTATSTISQADADKRATQTADATVQSWFLHNVPAYEGSSLSPDAVSTTTTTTTTPAGTTTTTTTTMSGTTTSTTTTPSGDFAPFLLYSPVTRFSPGEFWLFPATGSSPFDFWMEWSPDGVSGWVPFFDHSTDGSYGGAGSLGWTVPGFYRAFGMDALVGNDPVAAAAHKITGYSSIVEIT